MSTGSRSTAADGAGNLAGAVRGAEFVRLVAAADGDALAAAGLLARGCRAADVPFQASVARTEPERERRLSKAEGDLGVLVGADRAPADHVVAGRERPASVAAHATATELGADPDPVLALAGAFAAGVEPGTGATADLLEAAREAGAVERRPGVALPVERVADGLAHQSLVHGEFAGDEGAAAELASDAGFDADDLGLDADDPGFDGEDAPDEDNPGEDARQRLASLVALEVAGDERATPRTADALERALRPYATPDGPFATVGGHADVLEAVAREAPGTGVALALDGALAEPALNAWREHGQAAHAAVRSTTTGRYDGLFVARLDADAPVETVARLVLESQSPEPAVLAVSDEAAAAVAAPDADLDVGARMRAAVEAVSAEGAEGTPTDGTDCEAGGGATRAYARHDAETRAFISAFREVDR